MKKIKAILIPLGMLINEMKEGNELLELLSSFSCEKDEDIEYFLHNRAIEFEKLSKARTYLVLDQEQLEKNIDWTIIPKFKCPIGRNIRKTVEFLMKINRWYR